MGVKNPWSNRVPISGFHMADWMCMPFVGLSSHLIWVGDSTTHVPSLVDSKNTWQIREIHQESQQGKGTPILTLATNL